MNLPKLVLKISMVLAALLLPPIWLVSTNQGLNSALTVGSWFSPVKVSYGRAEGNLLGKPIRIENIVLQQDKHKLQIAEFLFNWHQRSFSASKITGFEAFLPEQELLALDRLAVLEQIHGTFELQETQQAFDINIDGIWHHEPLAAKIQVVHSADNWQLISSNLQISNNILNVKPTTATGYAWELKLPQPKLIFKDGYGALTAIGSIDNVQHVPELNATISADNFGLHGYAVKKMRLTAKIPSNATEPMQILASAEQVVFDDNTLTAVKINIKGNLNQHSIDLNAKYAAEPIRITANGALNDTVWSTKNLALYYQQHALLGKAEYDFANTKIAADLHGNPFAIATKINLQADNLSELKLKLDLHANAKNNLHADLAINATKLSGDAKLQAEDLSLIMQLLPDITRLKGSLTGQAKISGTLTQPIVLVDAQIMDITATIPALGIKIKPMELHVKSDANGKFILQGKGKMRRGPGDFTIHGYIEPFKENMPNKLTLVGNNIEFVNNADARLIATNTLYFNYDAVKSQLNINGDIDIKEGVINFNPKNTSTVKSKDVIFINDDSKTLKNSLSINPDINLRISEGVHFNGFGLDADITGKLEINKRHDTIYGTGRVTIKEGSYQLPGQKLQIQKGRLLYPPGTLLANPSLDIKMFGNHQVAANENVNVGSDLEIIVQGTAQAPIIHESGLGDNTDKALSQALLAGSSMLTKNILQEKFKLSELGLASHDDQGPDFFDKHTANHSSIKNKDLVIGRPLGKRFYLQYLHSMGEENKRVRLKYALGKHWAVGVETGDQGGGADLSFAIEKD